MSDLLDERVVEMRFDNADFEHNVDQSIKTINRLKESLDFDEAGESFNSISRAAASCDLSPMEDSIEEISVKFNMLDLVAANVVSNIVNKVADAGVKLAKSLTLDQISAGWNKYEQKTQAVQTIMAATGQSIDEVNSQLEKLIWFADETSYSFTDMVNNIGKFTSAGVDLDTAVKSMMGISDWAALSGAGVQQASRVMYNLSQSIGMGYVAIQDWKSVELANMATLDFKEAVIDTALAMGKIVQVGDKFKAVGGKVEFTAETMRNSLKEKWFDSDVLNAALEEYSSFADEVREYQEEHNLATAKAAIKLMEQEGRDLTTRAAQAFIKAQEAITFTQVVESVQDAVSSQLMHTFELIFGNYEQAKRLWSDLADDLWDIFASPGERFNDMLGEVLNSDYQKLVEELPDKLEFNNALYKKLYDITKANAGKDYADALFSQYDNIEDLLKNTNIFGSTLQTAFGSIAQDYDKEYERLKLASKNFEDKIISLKQVAIRLSGGMYGHDEETITKNLEKIGLKYEEVADYAEIWYQMGDEFDWTAAQKDFEAGLKERIKMTVDFRTQIRELLKVDDLFDSLTEMGGRDKLIAGFDNIIEFLKQFYLFVSEVLDGLSHLFGRESFLSFMIDGFYKLSSAFGFAAQMFEVFIDPIHDLFYGGIQDKFDKFVNGYDKWVEDAKTLDSGIVVGAFEHVPGLVERLTDFYKAHLQSLPTEVQSTITKISGNVTEFFNKVPQNITDLETKILGTKKTVFRIFEDGSKKLVTYREGGIFSEWKESLNTFADGLIPKALNGITGFLEQISGFLFGYKDDTKEFQGAISWVFDKVKAFIDLLKTIGKDAKDIFSTVFNDIKTFFTGGKYSFSDSTIWALPARLKKHFEDLKKNPAYQEVKQFLFGKTAADGTVLKNNLFGKISRVVKEFASSKAFIDVKEFFFGNEANQEIPGVFGRIKDFVSNIGKYIETVKAKFHEFRQWLGLDFYQYFTWNPETKDFESHWQRIHGAIDIAKDKVTEFGQKISTTFSSIWDSSIVQSVIKFISGDYFEGGPVTWKTALFGNKETEELSFLQYQLERIKGTDWFSNIRDFLFGVKNTNLDVNGSALNSFIRFFHTAEEYEQANIFGKIKLAFQDLKVYLFGWKENADETGASIEGVFDKVKKKIDEIRNSKAFNDILDFILGKKKVVGTDINELGQMVPIIKRTGGLINGIKDKIVEIKKIFANPKEWFDNIITDAGYTSFHDFIYGNDKIGLDNILVRMKNSLHDFFLGDEAKGIDNFLVRTKNHLHDFFLGNKSKGMDNIFVRMKNGFDVIAAKFEKIKAAHPWLQSFCDFIDRQIEKVRQKVNELIPGFKDTYESIKRFFFGYNIGGKIPGVDAGSKHIDGLMDRIGKFVQKFKKIDIFNNQKSNKSLLERIVEAFIGTGSFINRTTQIADTIRRFLPAIAGILLLLSIDIGGFHISNPFENLVDPLMEFAKSLAIIIGLLLGIPLIVRLFNISGREVFDSFLVILAATLFLVRVSEALGDSSANIVKNMKDAIQLAFLINLINTITAFITTVSLLVMALSVVSAILGVDKVVWSGIVIAGLLLAIGGSIALIYNAASKAQKATGKVQSHGSEIWGMAAILFGIGSLILTLVIAFTWLNMLTNGKNVSDFKTPLLILAGILSAVALFIGITVGSIAVFSTLKPIDKSIITALISLELLIGAMMLFAALITIGSNKNDWQTLAAAFGGISIVVLAMGGCLAILASITNLPLRNVFALIGIFTALATIVTAVSVISKLTGTKIKPLDIFRLLISIGEILVALFPVAGAVKVLSRFSLSGSDYWNAFKVLVAIGILAGAVAGLAAIANGMNIHTCNAILPMLVAIGEVAVAMVVTSVALVAASALGETITGLLLGAVAAIVGFGVLAGAVAGLAAIANRMNIHTCNAILPMLVAIGEVAVAMVVTSVALVVASALGEIITGLLLGAVAAIVGFGVLAGAVAGLAAIANRMNIHTCNAILPMLVAIGEVAAAMVITSGALVLAGALGSIMILLLPGIIAAFLGFGLLISKLQTLANLADDIDSGDIEKVSEFIVGIGRAFGQMIGAFIGGIGEGLTSSLPQIGENISGFMIALQPFLDAVKLIDDSHVNGATNFMKIMGTIVADEALGWLATLFANFTGDKVQTATNLGDFIAALEPFLSRVSGLTETDVNGAKFFTAIMTTLVPDEALAWLTTLFDKFTDDKVKAATNLGDFVTALEPFLSGVATLKESDKEGAALLTEIMKEVVKTEALKALDNVINYFCGTTNYSLFTYNLKTIAQGIVDLNSKLSENGITKDVVDNDIDIIRSVLDLVTDSKYKSGGLAGMFDSILNGKTDFKALFDKLNTDVADGFAEFARKVKGIETADAEKAVEVLPSILNLLSGNGYRVGGIKGWFTNLFEGENNYDAMFEALIGGEGKKGIIDYMSELSTKIKGLDNLNDGDLTILSTAADAIKSVFEMMTFNTSDLISDNKKTWTYGMSFSNLSDSDYGKMVDSLKLIIYGDGSNPGIPQIISEMQTKLESVNTDIIQNTIGTFLELIKMLGSIGSGGLELDTQGISDVGKYVVEGLAISLESEESTSRIKTAAINLGKAIIEGLQIGTEEQSPSKAAMVVGQFVAQGLTNGLLAGEPLTWAMARQFGEGTIKALKDGAERYAQYGLAEHAINMVTEDLLDENIFNMPDFSFVNHLGMDDIDFEKMRGFLQEKFGEVFDPQIIDGFVNSYMHEFNKLPKEIKKSDYAKLMTDIAKGDYGLGQDDIINSLTEELGSVSAAEQAWADYNDVLEGNIKINKDLLKQRKQNPPMTYEDYMAMIQHEQEGIDLLNKGFFHDLAGKNGTTVEEEMANWGFNPKTTQQAIDAMYMSSEDFYKFYEEYLNRRADEAEQDRLLRERQKEYENLSGNVKETKEQTDDLAKSTDNLNHLAANVMDSGAGGITVIDDSGVRKAADEIDKASKDIVNTVIENYQNGAEVTQEQIKQLLTNTITDGTDPKQTLLPSLEKAGIEISAFFDYLNQFASDRQKNTLDSVLTNISDTIEESAETVTESSTKYSSSLGIVKKMFGKSADELIKSGEMTQKGIDYLNDTDSKALNNLITNIRNGATDLKEADYQLLHEFREATNTYGAFGISNGKSEKENNFTAFGLSQDNYKFIWDYLTLGDAYIDQLKEEKKASAKTEQQNKDTADSMKESGEAAADSWMSGLTGMGKEFTDFLSKTIQEAADKGMDKVSIPIDKLPFLSDDLKKKYASEHGDDNVIEFSFQSMGLEDSKGNKLNGKDILKQYGMDFVVGGILGNIGFGIDDTLSGSPDDILNALLTHPEDVVKGLTDINDHLNDQGGLWNFLKDGLTGFWNNLLGIEKTEEELNETTLDFKTDNKDLEQSKAYLQSLYDQYKLTQQEENLVKSGYKNLTNGGAISKQQEDALTKMFNGITIGTYGDTNAFHDYLEGLEIDWEKFLTFYYKGLDEFTSTAQSYARTVKENSEYTTADLVKDIYNGKWGEGLDRKKAFEMGNIDYDKAHEAYKYWLENGQDDAKLLEKYKTERYAILTDEEAELLKQQETFETALATTSEGAFKSIGDFLKGVNQVLEKDSTADSFNDFINNIVNNLKNIKLPNAPAFEQIANFIRTVKSLNTDTSESEENFGSFIKNIEESINSVELNSTQFQPIADFLNNLIALSDSASKIIAPFTNLLKDMVELPSGEIGGKASEAATTIVETVLETFEKYYDRFTEVGRNIVIQVINGMLSQQAYAATAAATVSSTILNSFQEQAVAKATEMGQDFATSFAESITSEDVGNQMKSAFAALFGLGEATTEGMAGATPGLMGGQMGATGSIGQELGQRFSSDFLGGFTAALQPGGPASEAVAGLQAAFSSIFSMGEGPDVGEAGSEATSGMTNKMTSMLDDMAKGMSGAIEGDAGRKIGDAAKQLNKKISVGIPDGYGLGVNFVQGLLNGLLAGIATYGGAIQSAAATLGALCNVSLGTSIGAQSPSRTAMKFGGYFVEGFAIGLGKNHNQVYDTGYAIGTAVNEGVKDSLGIHSPSEEAKDNAENYTGTMISTMEQSTGDMYNTSKELGTEINKGTVDGLNSGGPLFITPTYYPNIGMNKFVSEMEQQFQEVKKEAETTQEVITDNVGEINKTLTASDLAWSSITKNKNLPTYENGLVTSLSKLDEPLEKAAYEAFTAKDSFEQASEEFQEAVMHFLGDEITQPDNSVSDIVLTEAEAFGKAFKVYEHLDPNQAKQLYDVWDDIMNGRNNWGTISDADPNRNRNTRLQKEFGITWNDLVKYSDRKGHLDLSDLINSEGKQVSSGVKKLADQVEGNPTLKQVIDAIYGNASLVGKDREDFVKQLKYDEKIVQQVINDRLRLGSQFSWDNYDPYYGSKQDYQKIEILSGTLTDMTNTISGNLKTLSDTTKETFTNIKDVFSSIGSSVNTSHVAKSAIGVVSNFTKTVETTTKSSGERIGKFFTGGIAAGISKKEQKDKAKEKIKGVVSGIKKVVTTEAKIASPSKVFMEFGEYMVEGLALGIKNSTHLAEESTGTMANTISTLFSGSVSNIGDLVESDLNTEPVIRPVIDMSEVESSAQSIDSMLSRDQAVNIATNQNTDDYQNGEGQSALGATYNFTQNNYSPKALSRLDIYRQTKNQFAMVKGMHTQ